MNKQKETAKVVDFDSAQEKRFEKEWKMELNEWLESIDAIKENYGNRQVSELLKSLQNHALNKGMSLGGATLNTPYRNTIPLSEQPSYPGDIELDLKSHKEHSHRNRLL